ncbi:helix-turn-helix domain-containing protein [Dactylosporangium sp. CA-139114]|uniref:helix-turn-helix domain-containing protein n=1 Tax=Dactylosporangium sp. CA-139114 TaxID=3239931 RepID=UPI003D99B17F
MTTGSVGERIGAYRRRRGLSQAALAGLVGRSESWLSQVERGVRSVDRLSVLLDLAKVLRVEVEALTGQPWQYAPGGSPIVGDLAEVRRFFARYDSLLGVESGVEILPTDVGLRVEAAHRAYQAAQYERVVEQLPALLSSAEPLRWFGSGAVRREALVSYVNAYAMAAKLLTKMGAADLALLSADRAASAAVDAYSVEARGMAAYQVVCALLRADRAEDAERLAVQMAEAVQRESRPERPTVVSVAGALWLIAAVIAGRRTDRGEAWRRLDQADTLAAMLGQDGNYAWTAFGPTNVAIHRVSVAAELGDPAEAIRAADAVDPDRLPAGLNSRRAQVHLDLAWAHVQRKRDADALLHLMEAERTAPEMVRYNVMARELVREMLARQKKSKTSALHRLAVRAGVLD